MIFKPAQLGQEGLDHAEVIADRKACRRFGPCGAGKKALYLGSFYLDCRYYIPYSSVSRVFKRIAMSQGGFSHKGVFASIPYLVVEYDGGAQKQCAFKHEEQVDQLLSCLEREHPEIKRLSADGEQRLAARERKLAARVRPDLSDQARKTLESLRKAEAYLNKRPELALELSQSARNKRTFLRSRPSYRWAALAITLIGLLSLLYGVFSFIRRRDTAVYFALFGLAAIFMFSGASVLPTARNNKKAVLARAEAAQKAMEGYISFFPGFPLPACYAHPIVLQRMCRAIEAGRAVQAAEALEAVKQDLRALNADVEVDQEEYDEVVAIKPMFLNEDYRS